MNSVKPSMQKVFISKENKESAQPTRAPDLPPNGSRTIRVLLVITALGTGGATNVVLDIADHFNKHSDFDIQVATGPIPADRTDLTALAHQRGIRTRLVPSLVNHLNPLANLKAVADLRRLMVREQFDIVHTHSSVAGVVGRVAARAAGVPVIIHHVHGWAFHPNMPRGKQVVYSTLERFCARYTTRIVTVSEVDVQKGMAQHIGGEEKFALIYNGIDLEKFQQPVDAQQVRSELGLAEDCKLVGMIGRLDDQKNPLDFIQAAAVVAREYPKVQFLIVGDGYLRPECERLIHQLNLSDKVFLLGFRYDVARILSILTITALSSLWEGLPLVFLEAMSAGKPIVANDVDGASNVVIHGKTGFLVTQRSPVEMADRILYLLRNEAICSEMGHAAQQRAQYFTVQRMVGEVEALYHELHSVAQPDAIRQPSTSGRKYHGR